MKEFIFLCKNYNFDAIQIPMSIINQSFDNAQFKKIVKKKKIFVEARSIFMQGLIFMEDKEINKKFDKIKKKILILNNVSNNQKIKKISICLEYIKRKKFIKSIIIGTNSVWEFKEILKSYYLKKIPEKKINYKTFRSNSKYINIDRW
jgi:aryl-alcohol dehydrogenase-like predicted oxidoreductase